MSREVHVRFCESRGVRFPPATHLVRLTVADNGDGFDPDAATRGYGLKGMRDRVRQVGGTVGVTSAPGLGTQVSAEVPG
jgi:signal transduction histidine kinase